MARNMPDYCVAAFLLGKQPVLRESDAVQLNYTCYFGKV